ncbi:hypothetical protein [Erythrobacter sp. YT30]|uniref:hypothetical protein n=1 Tax=Erythrobacter sp. YT30 TaxID=1735012 RepID=UPI00076DB779|nr:hypothetical protein [Erythrobacter sp. YT30]KWV91109.1 hypothetical protein AUC45_07260 [Erythrobacter sp. YT30]
MRAFAVGLASLVTVFAMPGAALAQSADALPISRSDLETKARDACSGAVTLSPTAIRRADLDRDGRSDVLFDWAQVTCQSGSAMMKKGAGFCGMHNCSIDIYLSSQYRPGDWPKPILNHREIEPTLVGNTLRTSSQGGSCEFAHVCKWEWSWNGTELESRALKAADDASSQPMATALPVTIANLAGNWVELGDGCASDVGMALNENGAFSAYEQNGDWRLLGKRIAIVVRETYILGDADSTRPVTDPKPIMLTVESLTDDQLTVTRTNGARVVFRKCG